MKVVMTYVERLYDVLCYFEPLMWVNMDENELLMHKHFILRMTIPGKMLGSEIEAWFG